MILPAPKMASSPLGSPTHELFVRLAVDCQW